MCCATCSGSTGIKVWGGVATLRLAHASVLLGSESQDNNTLFAMSIDLSARSFGIICWYSNLHELILVVQIYRTPYCFHSGVLHFLSISHVWETPTFHDAICNDMTSRPHGDSLSVNRSLERIDNLAVSMLKMTTFTCKLTGGVSSRTFPQRDSPDTQLPSKHLFPLIDRGGQLVQRPWQQKQKN